MDPNSPVDIWFVPSNELKPDMYTEYPNEDNPGRIVVNYNRLNTKERFKKFHYAFEKVFSGIDAKLREKEREISGRKIPRGDVIKKFVYNTHRTRKGESMTDKMSRLKLKIQDAHLKWEKFGN